MYTQFTDIGHMYTQFTDTGRMYTQFTDIGRMYTGAARTLHRRGALQGVYRVYRRGTHPAPPRGAAGRASRPSPPAALCVCVCVRLCACVCVDACIHTRIYRDMLVHMLVNKYKSCPPLCSQHIYVYMRTRPCTLYTAHVHAPVYMSTRLYMPTRARASMFAARACMTCMRV
jgi:hypothetical protein